MNTDTLLSSLAITLALGSACSTPDQNNSFCDDTIICDQQSDIPFCDIVNNTCIAPPAATDCDTAMPCDDDALPVCKVEASGPVCVECLEASDCTGSDLCDTATNSCVAFSCTEEASGPLCVECLETSDCTGSDLCDTATNSCVAFSCTEDVAGNAACLENFPDTAFCGDAGACVECRESGHCTDSTAAVCEDFACTACTSDSDCDGFCETGECVDSLRFVYVATDGVATADCGREDNPCNSVVLGLSEATEVRNELRIQAGTYSQTLDFTGGTRVLRAMGTVVFDYSNAQVASDIPLISVENSADLSIIGIDFELPSPSFSNKLIRCLNTSGSLTLDSISTLGGGTAISTACALTVVDSTISNPRRYGIEVVGNGTADVRGTVFTDDFATSGNNSEGIRCINSGDVTISGSSVSGFRYGIFVSGCDTTLHSSKISNNAQVGAWIEASNFDVTNNFIVNNGSPSSFEAGMALFSTGTPGTQRFDFNTVAGNQANASVINMECRVNSTLPLVGLGNILWGAVPISNNVGLSNCSFASSSVEGMTNFEPEFVNPVAGANGDYHLKPNSACIDQVDTDTLDIDFDGDMRPMGIRHDMGADEAL